MITIIAAIAKNNALGKDNDLIWHLPEDLKRFKKTTTGHSILMGRNTFESIGRPLPNRTSIIITRNENYFKDGCLIANSLEAAIELVKEEAQIRENLKPTASPAALANLLLATCEGRLIQFVRSEFKNSPLENWDVQWEFLNRNLLAPYSIPSNTSNYL